ncbi:MAG: hypothetical protein IPO33_01320 [Saprospiraceae bacterium]|nr:hypothetical protein [Candidatus Brachybacter algidus]
MDISVNSIPKLSDPNFFDFVDPTTGEAVPQKFRLEEEFLGTITNGTQNAALANYNNGLTEADILSENFVTTNGQFSESTLFNEIFGFYNNVGRTYNTFRKDEKILTQVDWISTLILYLED